MNIRPLPERLGFCLVVPNFLSPAECRRLIEEAEDRGFVGAGSDYPPSYRNNERQVVDDAALAANMALRLREHLPAETVSAVADGRPEAWRLEGVNERLRFCRYRESQSFHIHQDGVHHRGEDLRSRLTFMVYLTDGDAFEGGDTLFFEGGPAAAAPGQPHPPVVARIRPRAGSLIVFDHAIWHAGDTVTRGVKHILRSDVMYRRITPPDHDAEAAFRPEHRGYVWTLGAMPGGRFASGGRDTVIRLWNSAGLPLGQLHGHAQSVLGLAMLGDGRLASVSRDRTLRAWNLGSRECEIVARPHDGAILSVAAWQGQAVTGGADGTIRSTELRSGEVSLLASGTGWIWSLAVSRDGLLAAASEDERIWWREPGHASALPMSCIETGVALRTLDLSADGLGLAVGDIEGRVSIWKRQGEDWTRSAAWRAHAAATRRVRWDQRGRLWSAGEDGRIRQWRSGEGRPIWEAMHDNFATDVLAMDDGTVFTCAYDGRIVRHAPTLGESPLTAEAAPCAYDRR